MVFHNISNFIKNKCKKLKEKIKMEKGKEIKKYYFGVTIFILPLIFLFCIFLTFHNLVHFWITLLYFYLILQKFALYLLDIVKLIYSDKCRQKLVIVLHNFAKFFVFE